MASQPIISAGLIAGLLIWLLVVAFCGLVVRRVSGSAWLGVLTGTVLFVLPIWDLPFGLAMYKRYADELGGTRIRRTVEADGYLQSPSHTLDFIVRVLQGAQGSSAGRAVFPYSYYEGRFNRGSARDFIQEAGYYEIRLADRGNSECAQFEAWPGAATYREYWHISTRCIVAVRRDEPRSRYEVVAPYYRQALPGPRWLPPVWAVWTKVIDRQTGEVLAQQYDLRYESWFPMPTLDEYRPLAWTTRSTTPLQTLDVIRPPQSVARQTASQIRE